MTEANPALEPTHYITQHVTNPKFGDIYYGDVKNLAALGLTAAEIKIMEDAKLAIKLADMPKPPDPKVQADASETTTEPLATQEK